MIRTPTTETVRQTDYRADSRNGILQHYGCIVPSGILRSSQFRIFLKLPLGNIICIGKLVFQILQQDTVIKEQVETFTVAITTGSQHFRCIYRSLPPMPDDHISYNKVQLCRNVHHPHTVHPHYTECMIPISTCSPEPTIC